MLLFCYYCCRFPPLCPAEPHLPAASVLPFQPHPPAPCQLGEAIQNDNGCGRRGGSRRCAGRVGEGCWPSLLHVGGSKPRQPGYTGSRLCECLTGFFSWILCVGCRAASDCFLARGSFYRCKDKHATKKRRERASQATSLSTSSSLLLPLS